MCFNTAINSSGLAICNFSEIIEDTQIDVQIYTFISVSSNAGNIPCMQNLTDPRDDQCYSIYNQVYIQLEGRTTVKLLVTDSMMTFNANVTCAINVRPNKSSPNCTDDQAGCPPPHSHQTVITLTQLPPTGNFVYMPTLMHA